MKLFEYFGEIILRDDNVDKKLDNIDSKAGKTGGTLDKLKGFAGKVGIGLAAVGVAAGAAAVAIGVKAFSASEDLQKSLNGLQAATGETDGTMQDMKKSMLDIYNNNFGDSFEDIGQSMTAIYQQTKLSGQALTDLTQNALAVRDTFDFEVNESVRSANMLMNQFGLSSKDAYNLIAQGAQKGLNKNDDLLDTINEYSVQFKGLGFNAEEMFNMLSNGAASGVFSIDKLGDSVKEFSIRSKDGSKTTIDAFSALGLNANQISSDFAKGGESGKKAFESVTKKLLEMKDPLAQNQVGVALFGSMWEDLSAKGIAALTNTNGEISKTVDALGKINAVKYNTFGEALEGMKRQLMTGLVVPLGDAILPKLGELSTWVNANMPAIKDVISNAFTSIGTAISNVSDVVLPILKQGFEFFTTNVLPNLKLVFDSYVQNVLPALSSAFNYFSQNILPIFIDLFKGIAEKILPPVTKILQFIYTEIIPKLVKAFEQWMPTIADIFRGLKDIILGVVSAVVKAFEIYWPYISGIVSNSINIITDVIGGVLKVLQGIINFIVGVFTGDWKRAWEGVKQIFSGIFDSIVGVLKGAVNLLIGAVNFLIRGLNKIKVDIPSWVPGLGGESFGITIPEIPKLAVGTDYVPKDMLSYIHEGEQVVPKKYNPNNPNNQLSNGNGNYTIEVPLIIDGKEFAKATAKFTDKELFNQNRRGVAFA